MSSTITLRSDPARTGTNSNFSINGNPWRKYVSVDLGTTTISGNTLNRVVRAGVLVVDSWFFNSGPHKGETHTLVLVATTTNELFCYGEGSLLTSGATAAPLWQTSLGKLPITRGGSNIAPPVGICGTPVVDTPNNRMFVVAMWDDGSATGHYSIFNISLDTGVINTSQELVDADAAGRATFNPDLLDQRTAINLVNGWLWLGFADFLGDDLGRYYGWVVAINSDNLAQQLYQPMVSLNSSATWGIFAGGVWGVGGVAAAEDGTVYALTGNATQVRPGASGNDGADVNDDLTSFGLDYWDSIPPAGPGSVGDYFNALVRLGIEFSGATPQLKVLDWFQGSAFTRDENAGDLDFGGSSPVVLPPLDGRQLVAFVPKDGGIFLLDSQNLGHFSNPMTQMAYGDPSNDTKLAIAFMQTADNRNVLLIGANTQGPAGGFAAFQVDAAVNPPTLTKLWQSASPLRDSFGSPVVIANPTPNAPILPNPVGLTWVIDGDDASSNFLGNCAMRAYDVLSGKVAYDSTSDNEVTEQIPHFTPITSGANSVFCATSKGFIGFTQFVPVARSLTFIVDRSTFGKDEVDAQQPTSASVASFGSAYWISVNGVLPSDLGLTPGNLSSPPQQPTVTAVFDSALPASVATAIRKMLNAGQFTGPVIAANPALPDEPQNFLFPYTITFTGDQGFAAMAAATPAIGATLITLEASLPGTTLSSSAQIELVTGADPFFIDVNPSDPTQPLWLSFDLRLFKVMGNSIKFGAEMTNDPAAAPGFITQVITNLNANNGVVGVDSFSGLTQDEDGSALEFNPSDNNGHPVFNFALARVRLVGKTPGPTSSPVRVFFRLFQAQNTISNFNPATTYRFATDGTPHGRKIPLLGVQTDSDGPEYVTIPCFATKRVNLPGPADMSTQTDAPNAYPISIVTAGVAVDSYFGCWVDSNQPNQKFLPSAPTAGNLDGPFSGGLESIQAAILSASHQCLIAEIRYDDAPVIPDATPGTSDKLAQRNIAWIDGPNPGLVESRRMTHPVQIRPTPIGAQHPDELMIFWGSTPLGGQAQLYLPALKASEISGLATHRYPGQQMDIIDEHTVGFATGGATFVPLPTGSALAAGLLTVNLPPGIRKGDQYQITVRQITDAQFDREPTVPAPPPAVPPAPVPHTKVVGFVAAPRTWRRVEGAFQFVINIKTKSAILLKEERLLATLRYMILQMPATKRWYPVMQRYIDYVAGRVQGFGGNPSKILPSPVGWAPGLPEPSPKPGPRHPHGDREEYCGKVQGLLYDHFGDFEGFIVENERGMRHRVLSREHAVRELAEQARVDRSRVKAIVERPHHLLLELEIL